MFYTFQGEGAYMGQPAFFVRLYGCPVHCPWCDSAGTWHPSWVPKDVQRLTPEAITKAAIDSQAKTVVITGGEPAIFDLEPLSSYLHDAFLEVHLETSGAFMINGDIDWITVSPKKWKPPVASSVHDASEFKIIVEQPSDIPFYLDMLHSMTTAITVPIWLHPEWSHSKDRTVLNAISEAVKSGSGQLRAGWQLHKCYQVDNLDNRTRALVPLGGDPNRGY